MTNEEAIKWIKDHHCPDGFETDCNDTRAMRIAINAIEKQIPKKPVLYKRTISFECPVCGGFVGNDLLKYNVCDACHQQIDWSEEE